MSYATDRIIFRIKVDQLISKYSKEVQTSLMDEINQIMILTKDEVLTDETLSLIIYYYFKIEKLKKD